MKKWIMAALMAFTAGSFAAPSFAEDGDVKKGEKLFKRCKACHKVEEGKNGIGPHLFGIVDRDVASVEDFKYSKAMAAYGEGDEVWDAARLDTFLTKPKNEVKGTAMKFAGLKKEKQRVDLIAYLATLK